MNTIQKDLITMLDKIGITYEVNSSNPGIDILDGSPIEFSKKYAPLKKTNELRLTSELFNKYNNSFTYSDDSEKGTQTFLENDYIKDMESYSFSEDDKIKEVA